MKVKILGTGCTKCTALEKKVKDIVSANNIDAEVEKVSDIQDIMKYGILMTPGLVVDEKVVSFGVVPKDNDILNWLKEAH